MSRRKAAVGIVEFLTVAAGLSGTDHAVKNNDIALMYAESICPGGYLLMFGGGYAAVSGAVSMLRAKCPTQIREANVIGNLSDGVIGQNTHAEEKAEAIGVIETADTVSAVYAADEAVKTAGVRIESMRLANGLGGKGIVLVSGGIAETQAAVARAAATCRTKNSLIADAVIANPHEMTWKALTGQRNNTWR